MLPLCCYHYDAASVSTPNVDGCKGLSNASRIIIVLQFPDIASSTGWFSPPLLCDGTILVRCTMPKEKTRLLKLAISIKSLHLSKGGKIVW
nr:hypothetical protein Iba_chr14dCG13850 [Ipomoea batatas]